ncbi:MAG TPA: hypothetical protein VL137_17410, partial [Polyangiaceae bacterium]|nr:hypothetical protein [Polyangiaceae bacterium]
MEQFKGLWLIVGCVAVLSSTGCGPRQQGPKMVSSTSQPAYAVTFPSDLDQTGQRLAATDSAAQAATRDLPEFPSKVRSNDAAYLEQLYNLANAEGRSESYSEGFANAQVVDDFVTRDKNVLTSRIASANEQVVEKAGGSKPDLYGSTSYALEHGVQQSLEDDLKDRSDAQKSIEQNKRKLGEHDAATLSTQVQQISMASHVVFVELPLQKARAQRLLSQTSDVDSTLKKRSEELSKIDTKGMSYEDKKWLKDETDSVN